MDWGPVMAFRRSRREIEDNSMAFSLETGENVRAVQTRMQIAMEKMASSILEELEYGSSGTLDDRDSPGSEDPWLEATIDDVHEYCGIGEDRSRTPWGCNAMENRGYYTVDTGHTYVVKPRDENADPSSESVRRVEDFIELFADENDWANRQEEVSHRLDQHGEVFDLMRYDTDGMLRLGFGEPTDLTNDPDSPFQQYDDSDRTYIDLLGIRRTNDLHFEPTQFFIDGLQKGIWIGDFRYALKQARADGAMIPNFQRVTRSMRTLAFYRRRNVLSVAPRGMTFFWPVRDELRWSKLLMGNLMRISAFQSSIGALRTINDTVSSDAVRQYLASAQDGTKQSQSESMDAPAPMVVTKPASIKWEFPDTGLGNSNHIEVLIQLLRAASSGMRLPEFMLTANVSEGNFASTLVSEGPYHKAIRRSQQQMIREDLQIIDAALKYAAESGKFDLTMADVQAVKVEAKPPRVQTRNRQEDFEINQKLWEDGLLSGKDLLASEGYEYRPQHAQIQLERNEELPGPMALQKAAPGPDPQMSADQMKEPGVMKGDPGRRSQADGG